MPKPPKKFTPKRGGTQPNEHVATEDSRHKVGSFVCAGFSQEQICTYLGISLDTLKRTYHEELTQEKMRRTIVLSNNLYADAVEGDKDSRKFWLERQAKWVIPKVKEEDTKSSTDTLIEKLLEKL